MSRQMQIKIDDDIQAALRSYADQVTEGVLKTAANDILRGVLAGMAIKLESIDEVGDE